MQLSKAALYRCHSRVMEILGLHWTPIRGIQKNKLKKALQKDDDSEGKHAYLGLI